MAAIKMQDSGHNKTYVFFRESTSLHFSIWPEWCINRSDRWTEHSCTIFTQIPVVVNIYHHSVAVSWPSVDIRAESGYNMKCEHNFGKICHIETK